MTSSNLKHSHDGFDNDELMALAKWHIDKGNVEQALDKLKTILHSDSPPDEALLLGARLYAQLRLFDKAQALFRSYLDIHPDANHEAFQLGMTYFEAGKTQEAIETWERILNRRSIYPPALFYKALALSQSNDTDNAKQCLDQLFNTTEPDNLFFSRGKDLLESIEKGKSATAETLVKQPYETEH